MDGTVVTFAADVYMLGGLAYELLTAGVAPFDWIANVPDTGYEQLISRRSSSEPVGVSTGPDLPGLFGMSVLEAAYIDRRDIPWRVQRVQREGAASSGRRLECVKGLMAECLHRDPGSRPLLPALLARIGTLLGEERRCAPFLLTPFYVHESSPAAVSSY
jgi:hypothetical protein